LATVLAIGYPDEGTAARAAQELRRLRRDLRIEPDAVAVIARSAHGEYQVTTSHHPVGDGASWGMFWGLLFGLLFFVPVFGTPVGAALGALFGKIETNGINRAFQQQARDMVKPGTSALFLVTSDVDPDTAVAALSKFDGATLQSSLTTAQEAKLQDAIHGSLSPAAA
jgi:uncharacterized membrane protein